MIFIETVIVRRSSKENTVAIVNAVVDDGFADEQPNEVDALFAAISGAVTAWCHDTTAGRESLQSSSGDFNIGVLVAHCAEPTLVRLLRERGIQRLSVKTHADVSGHHWDYDDRLFDRALLCIASDGTGIRS